MDNGDIVQVRLYTKLSDQGAVNVRHYVASAKAGTGATLSDLLSALNTLGIPAAIKACINADAAYMGADAQVIKPILSVPTTSTAGNGFGDTAGDPLPRQTSGLISLRTALGGRRNRGRYYIPFPTETDNSATGHPTSTYVTAAAALGDLLITTLVGIGALGNTNTLTPVLYHRDLATTTPLTTALTSAKWATQRRRGDFGRPNTGPFG